MQSPECVHFDINVMILLSLSSTDHETSQCRLLLHRIRLHCQSIHSLSLVPIVIIRNKTVEVLASSKFAEFVADMHFPIMTSKAFCR